MTNPEPIAQTFRAPGEIQLTSDEKNMGALAHGLSFIEGGIVGPVVLYVVKKDDSRFIAFHALQSAYFGIGFLIISLVTCGIGAILLLIPYFVYEILATIKAKDGEWYHLPIVGSMAMKHVLANPPAKASAHPPNQPTF
jgi:uncharacterized protein